MSEASKAAVIALAVFAVLGVMQVLYLSGDRESPPAPPPFNKAQWDRVQIDMSEQEAAQILGDGFRVIDESESVFANNRRAVTRTLEWRGKGWSAHLITQEGKVKQKMERGLK